MNQRTEIDIIERLNSIDKRLRSVERLENTPVGETAGTSAYYRPSDGYLIAPSRIGIGTSSPQGLLDVNGGDSATDALFAKSSGATGSQGGIIHHQGSTYAWQETAQNTGSATGGQLQFHYVNRTSPGTKQTSNVLVLQGNGNVGIGTTSPGAYRLDVNGDTGIPLRLLRSDNGTLLRFEDTGNAAWAFNIDDTGFDLTYINASRETMTWLESGNVGIGTDSPSRLLSLQGNVGDYLLGIFNDGNANTRHGIYVSAGQDTNPTCNFMRFDDGNGTTVGYIGGNGAGGTTYSTTSDERTKTDIEDIGSVLDKLSALRPIMYRGKDAPKSRRKISGLTAQNVQEQFPELVTEDAESGLMQLNYPGMVPYLIGAIKELTQRVENLEGGA